MRLTQRDKVLLLAFVLLAIWALGIWFFVKPKVQDVGKANDDLTAINQEYTQVQQDLESAKTVKEDCNEILKQAQTNGGSFYGMQRAYEAEDIVETLLSNASNPIEITNMTITGPNAIAIVPYTVEDEAGLDIPIIDSVANGGQETQQTPTTNTLTGETVACYNYSVNFKATKENLLKFLDKVPTSNNKASLVVTNLAITDYLSDELEGNMSFTLYFIIELPGSNVDELMEQLGIGDAAAEESAS